ncbi:MAG TPA: heme biosynthesis HemY N-terminal domain-containing protein [Casimicrobiaceae bacterium]|nr:heme biosynthesis HemY N-terminal domain-containing protein [Casimicrobiaceae bacterium]
MRALVAFLLLAVSAVLVALLFRINDGYALFVAPPYRVELSLNTLLILVVLAFLIVHAVLRLASRLARLPRDVREHRRRQQLARARARFDAAVIALIEGRDGKAGQYASEALEIPQATPVAALVGARAALDMRDYDAALALLRRADAQAPSLAVPRLMLEAEAALEQGNATEALARLADLRREAGLHTAALRLEIRALTAAGRHGEIPAIVDQLVKRKVYDAEQGQVLRARAHAEAIAALTHDATGLRAYWTRLNDADREQPAVAEAAARALLAQGADREAADVLVRALERHWEPRLVQWYAECRTPDATRQLEIAERWLVEHNQDATLLYALGRLCERQKLWGKAQTYLEASLALDTQWRTELALGELCANLGRTDEANAHLAAALRLAISALDAPAV